MAYNDRCPVCRTRINATQVHETVCEETIAFHPCRNCKAVLDAYFDIRTRRVASEPKTDQSRTLAR